MHLRNLFLFLLWPLMGNAQSDWYHQNWDGSRLQLEVQKAINPTRVLYVAAHPDDENTRLIAWLSNELHAEVGYLSLTRGSGGQNLIGEEIGPELGAIREQELRAARRLDGGLQFFSSALDFGYSKTHEETLSKWDREKILGEVVERIRTFRPHIIITRFSPSTEGIRSTHGHHTASAMLALEAFRLAADSSAYPEQLSELGIWETEAIYWNTSWWSYGSQEKMDSVYDANPDYYVRLDVESYIPSRGMTVSEIAARSRSMHKSQGFGTMAYYGSTYEYLQLLNGRTNAKGRLHPSFNMLSSYINAPLEKAWREGVSPELIRQGMAEADRAGKLNASQIGHLERIYFQSMGVRAYVRAKSELVEYGTLECSLELIHFGDRPMQLELDSMQVLDAGKLYTFPLAIQVELGQQAEAEIVLDGYAMHLPVVYRSSDPVIGEIVQPVVALHAGAVNVLNPDILMVNGNGQKVQVEAMPLANVSSIRFAYGDRSVARFDGDFKAGQAYRFEIPAPEHTATLTSSFGDASTTLSHRKITYDHLPWIHMVQEARIQVHRIDAKVNAKRVAYVMGAGDRVPEAIRSLGVELQLIDPFTVSPAELRTFDVVVFGIRALNTIEGIDAAMDRFYSFAEKGGTLIMQYNTNHRLETERIGPSGQHIGLSRLRVTEEDAEVVLGTHRVLEQPNRIVPEDFDNWVQERGLYFPSTWPAGYAAPLSMHDAGEDPLQGSLLILDCGKGTFVYTGLSFFRELPAGVPGAYRLWANLLSL